MTGTDPSLPADAPVPSHLAVRRALGLLGLALPASLCLYARPLDYGMQPSIPEFYHTRMGDFLVGCLVGIGIFLIAYKGYPQQDLLVRDGGRDRLRGLVAHQGQAAQGDRRDGRRRSLSRRR